MAFHGNSGIVGDVDSQFMLAKGTAVPEEFIPAERTVLYLNEELTDKDKVTLKNDGTVSIEKNVKHVVLDGVDFDWAWHYSSQGFKILKATNISTPNYHTDIYKFSCTKFDGSKLISNRIENINSYSEDEVYLYVNNQTYIGVANTDSGWGESYTPTADEIKAYFNGWVMNEADGSIYESGTKRWAKRYHEIGTKQTLVFGADIENDTMVTDSVPKGKAYGDITKTYELWYDLESPDIYEKYLGTLSLSKGINYVTVLGEGDFTANVEYIDSIEDVIEQISNLTNELLKLAKDTKSDKAVNFQYDENGNLEVIEIE